MALDSLGYFGVRTRNLGDWADFGSKFLGLISTKTPVLESKDGLKRRIDEASKHLPLDQLCLSPQCGFASNFMGNPLTVDDEKRKLALVVETAHEVWD